MLQANRQTVTRCLDRPPPPLRLSGGAAQAASRVSGVAKIAVTGDLNSLEEEWRWFEASADCTPFQTFDWLSAWQTCVGAPAGVTPVIVTGRRESGELLFILPLAIETWRHHRRLVFLGRDLCDYNAPLLAPEFSQFVTPSGFAALWREIQILLLQTAGCQHDVVFFDKMPERLDQQENPALALGTMPNPSSAYLTDLDEDWERFYAAKRSSATRGRDRTKRKKLGKAGALRAVTPDTMQDTQRTLDTLFAQKSRSFARMGVRDLFAQPGHADFFRAAAAKAGWFVHVSRLEVGSAWVAANLGLLFRGRYYHVLASHDDGPLARLGPGIVHLHEIMRHAIAQGCKQFDFTIGDEPYKRDWADTTLALHDHISANSGLGRIVAMRMRVVSRAKRYVKRTPVLWRLASRLREYYGAIKSAKRPASSSDNEKMT